MSRLTDYLKYYWLGNATAVAADIVLGKIAYIAGGRVVGQGAAPAGSLTAHYETFDANITPYDVAAWKTAYGRNGLVLGLYYPGPLPATGGLMSPDQEQELHTPTGDTFSV